MKKMLMLATTAAMIEQFNKNNILILEEMRYEIHVAGNFDKGNPISDKRLQEFKLWLNKHNGKWFNIPSTRKPYDIKNNSNAYQMIVKLIKENSYDFIHCHTPLGAVIGRLAGHVTHTKVIYTAHGFHFYKGAPLLNWLLYYPVERWLAYYTDALITINKEDYERAKHFKAKKVYYTPGVGIDLKKLYPNEAKKKEMRLKLNIKDTDFVILSVGELTKCKNHAIVIRALANLKNTPMFEKTYYLICGQGVLEKYLKNLSDKLGVSEHVRLLGFQSDIPNICRAADIFVFPSKREGLGLAALEAMATGLPIITSDAGGIKDYSQNNITGYMLKTNDAKKYAKAILNLWENTDKCIEMGKNNILIAEKYSVKNAEKNMENIYKEQLKDMY